MGSGIGCRRLYDRFCIFRNWFPYGGKLYCSSARCDSWNGSNGDGSSAGKWNDRWPVCSIQRICDLDWWSGYGSRFLRIRRNGNSELCKICKGCQIRYNCNGCSILYREFTDVLFWGDCLYFRWRKWYLWGYDPSESVLYGDSGSGTQYLDHQRQCAVFSRSWTGKYFPAEEETDGSDFRYYRNASFCMAVLQFL